MDEPLILASASPRRREILALLGLPFQVVPAAGEVPPDPAASPARAAMDVARGKAEEVAASRPDRVVIGADTVVEVDGCLLGKPRDADDACAMLERLQGRAHRVHTGVWVCSPRGSDGFASTAQVTFYPMEAEEIAAYVATGEPMDKAGAYAIQGAGMRYIRGIQGDFYTVMGLPGAALWRFLSRFRE